MEIEWIAFGISIVAVAISLFEYFDNLRLKNYSYTQEKILMYTDIFYGKRKGLRPGEFHSSDEIRQRDDNWKNGFYTYIGKIDNDVFDDYLYLVKMFRDGRYYNNFTAEEKSEIEVVRKRFDEKCEKKIELLRAKLGDMRRVKMKKWEGNNS